MDTPDKGMVAFAHNDTLPKKKALVVQLRNFFDTSGLAHMV